MSELNLPPLKVTGEQGWVDLEFGLVSHHVEGDDEWHMFCAGARHADTDIAFNVLYPFQWNFDPSKGAPPGLFEWQAGMALVNAQPLHINFIKMLAQLYGLAAPESGMANFTEVSAVVLDGNPENVLHEAVSMKIFFGAYERAPIPYAEAYLNLDIRNRIVCLNEKDPEYRQTILQCLVHGTPEDPEEEVE